MSRSAPAWVCVEGPNGVGKTRLLGSLVQRFAARECALLAELTDTEDPVPREVIDALSTGDSFLRTGHPRTETFALLALKVREYERISSMTQPPRVVLEDRGVDTVAFYQAAIILGRDADDDDTWALACEIHADAAVWRPAPDLVLVLLDDLDLCLRRYAARTGAPVTGEERALVERVTRLYRRQAEHEPSRYRIVHRDHRTETSVIDEMEHLIRTTLGEPA